MDFSQLPPAVFLKIINYLPFEERLRIAGVDTHFRTYSKLAVSLTKSLDLSQGNDNEKFAKMTPDQFSFLLEKCSENLEEIILYRNLGDHVTQQENDEGIKVLAAVFAKFHCPRLISLDLGYYVDEDEGGDGESRATGRTAEGDEIFQTIVRQYPNLHRLSIDGWSPPFPTDMIFADLTVLHMIKCDRDVFQSMIGRFPNLKSVQMTVVGKAMNADLENFFAQSPKIIDLHIWQIDSEYFVPSFWRLPLRNFELPVSPIVDDDLLVRITTSFPDLVELRFHEIRITDRGLAALIMMKNLKRLFIHTANGRNTTTALHFDDYVQILAAGCPVRIGRSVQNLAAANLTTAQIDANISVATLAMIIKRSPHLKELDVRRITNGQHITIPWARQVARSLPKVENRKLTVRIFDDENAYIWCYPGVQNELASLGKNIGQSVTIGHVCCKSLCRFAILDE